MITIISLLKEILEPTREYKEQVDIIIGQGGKFLGSGDYGAAYLVGDIVKKVTTDEVEIEHALILKGKKTKYFVPVLEIEVLDPKLGIITMPQMTPNKEEVSEEFVEGLEAEAEMLGIDPEELDIRPDNFMRDKAGNLKMTDV